MALHPRWHLSNDARTGTIAYPAGDLGREGGKVLAAGSVHYVRSSARYEEGIADLDEPIDRAAEVENMRVLLAHVEQIIGV